MFFLFSLIYLVHPQSAQAYSCSITLTYQADVVVVQPTDQKLNCSNNSTITTFKNLLTVKGNVPNTFQMETYNIGLPEICKNFLESHGISSIPIAAYGIPHPQFEKNKKYLISTSPDSKDSSKFLPDTLCSPIFEEVTGAFDFKVIFSVITVYAKPFLIFNLFMLEPIGSFLSNFLPSTAAFILSIMIVLALYTIQLYLIYKGIRYLIRKIRK